MEGQQQHGVTITNSNSNSRSIHAPIAMRVNAICGTFAPSPQVDGHQSEQEVTVHVQLFHQERPLLAPQESTAPIVGLSEGDKIARAMQEPMLFAMRISEANLSTALTIILRDQNGLLIAGTTLYLFEEEEERLERSLNQEDLKQKGLKQECTKQKYLKQGHLKLKLWPKTEPTAPKTQQDCRTMAKPIYSKQFATLGRAEELLKAYEDGIVNPDRFQQKIDPEAIIRLREQEARQCGNVYLFVDLPILESAVIYNPELIFTAQIPPHPFLLLDREADGKMQLAERIRKRTMKIYGYDAKNLKPSDAATKYLNELIDKPLTSSWSPEHRALLWKYRYWLRNQERALPRFLHCIDWEDRHEVSMIQEIIKTWQQPGLPTCAEIFSLDAPLQPADLDLIWMAGLGRGLSQFTDKEFSLYMPMLLHFFRTLAQIQGFYPTEEGVGENEMAINHLIQLFLSRTLPSLTLTLQLYWRLKVLSKQISHQQSSADNIFARLLGLLLQRLAKMEGGLDRTRLILKQEELFNKLCNLFQKARSMRMNRFQRIEHLKSFVGDAKNGLLSFTAIPLPYDGQILVNGILEDKIYIFKSTAMPAKVPFITIDYQEYPIMVKAGVDLRQDAFVLYILSICDDIWRRNGLYLRLTAYKCLPLSLHDGKPWESIFFLIVTFVGILEFIPAEPLSAILAANNGSILSYLRRPPPSKLNSTFNLITTPSSNHSTGQDHSYEDSYSTIDTTLSTSTIPDSVMENYLCSCAGYCVFTYIMGIGDRHLDNLMLTRDGKLLHIDFSYIFGNDPKPFPPPMKLCKEMVEAMGGPQGAPFQRFKDLCFAAFAILRSHAGLLLACVKVAQEEATLLDGQQYVKERLLLDKEHAEALTILERLIDESMTALFPKVLETLHKWTQYWRQ